MFYISAENDPIPLREVFVPAGPINWEPHPLAEQPGYTVESRELTLVKPEEVATHTHVFSDGINPVRLPATTVEMPLPMAPTGAALALYPA